MAEGPDKSQQWLRENTLSHSFRAAAQSVTAVETPADETRSWAEVSDDLKAMQVRRRQSGWRATINEMAAERRQAGLPEQMPRQDGLPPLVSFSDFHPYADEAAALAVQRSEAAQRSAWHVSAELGAGVSLPEDVSVATYGSGTTVVEGSAYGIRTFVQQVLGNPLMQIGVSPAAAPEPVPQYPPTRRGIEAQRSWVYRLQDTPGGRETACQEAAILWAEAGMTPPDQVAPGVYVA